MSPTPPFLSHRFSLIIDGVCRSVAARMRGSPADGPTLMLLWAYLRRRIAQFAILAERVRNGTLPPSRPALPRPARRSGPPRPRLPQGLAWLLSAVPEAAAYGSQLHHLLGEPEMAALLEAAPQTGRILRPLCRMLGASPTPDLLPPPPPRRRIRPTPFGQQRPPPDPAAARRWPADPHWPSWSLRLASFPLPAPA